MSRPQGEDRASRPPGVLRLLRLCWTRLLAMDLAAKALGFLVLTPATAFLLGFLAFRSGDSVLTDEDILFFLLSPAGALAVLVIGVFSFWVVFFELAIMLTIGLGTAEYGALALPQAWRFVASRSVALFRLASALLLRLLALAAPFALLAGLLYLVLLTRFDINYYLSVRPPSFWVAAVLMGSTVVGLTALLATKLFHWLFALPLVLFDEGGAGTAMSRSHTLMKGRRLEVAARLAGWAAVVFVASALVTGLIGLAGRLLIPSVSQSLPRVALAVGAVVCLSGFANFTMSFLGAASLSLLVVRLYLSLGGGGHALAAAAEKSRLRGGIRRLQMRQLFIWGSLAVIVAVVVAAIAAARAIPMEDTTEITAHRGSSSAAPENTVAAAEQAIADGADWLEIDVQEAGDGTVIVFHDGDLKRLGGVPLRTSQSTYDELKGIDIGSWFSPEFADQRIPTLEQVLELSKGRIRVNIELKYYGTGGDLEQEVIDIVERHGMESQVVLMSLDRDRILRAKQLRPDWKMGLLTAVALGDLTKVGVDFLAVNAPLATPSLIWSAHRRGKEVHVWTANDPVQMWQLIGRGVDNLITDIPALGRTVMTERASLSTAELLLVKFGTLSELIPSSIVVPDGSSAGAPGGE